MSPAKRHEVGNGSECPDGHGRMYVLQSGREWCPDQSHDQQRIDAKAAAAIEKPVATKRRRKETL